MILISVIQLSAEFLNHVLVIVSVAFLLVELMLCRYRFLDNKIKRVVIILFAMSLFGGIMVLFEFFIGRGSVPPNLFLYIPGVIALLYLAFLSRKLGPKNISRYSFYSMVCSIAAVLIFTIMCVLTTQSIVIFLSTMAQTATIITFYFYALSFMIASDKET